MPRSTTIVLVDDNVHSGKSIAAVDRLLGGARETCAFAVAVTDAQKCSNALKPRRFAIEYDAESSTLDVRCALDPPRH